MTDTPTTHSLTDAEYQAALEELTEFERAIRESDRLSQEGTLEKAELLDKLFHDDRWIAERNAERIVTAKTPRGGRPVDPNSRSQFSTWLRGRFSSIAPRTTYQLLDANMLVRDYLRGAHVTPTSEWQLRPLKVLTNMAHGSGKRIPDIWEIACRLAAENGYRDPTREDVRRAIAQWNTEHLAPRQQRKENAHRLAMQRRSAALSAWHNLLDTKDEDEINAFLIALEKDLDKVRAGKSWASA